MRDGEFLALNTIARLARIEAEQRENGVEQMPDVIAFTVNKRAVLGRLANNCAALDAAPG